MKKTPWYPATIKPVRVGWYECRFEGETEAVSKLFWDGERWFGKKFVADNESIHLTLVHFKHFGNFVFARKDRWRGLKKPVDNEI